MTSLHTETEFDTSSHREFVEYYEKESLSEATKHRFSAIRERVIRLAKSQGRLKAPLDALDIGCGAGAQCLMWAGAGDRAHGIDINAPLVEIARERAAEAALPVRFEVGSATALPYGNGSMDVCLMPELLEHVPDWQACLAEAMRVLRPGGILYASTTNFLCPIQHEFNMPFYAWYPGPVKRHFERLAVTTRPEIANHARYPAVNWFSFYGLRRYFRERGMECFDRFDLMDVNGSGALRAMVVKLIKGVPPLRFLAHMCSRGTIVFAVKK